jgi:hypothetical protein
MGTARGNQQESGNRGVLTTDDTYPATAGRMGKRETISVKSVKSVVEIFWIRFLSYLRSPAVLAPVAAGLRLRFFALSGRRRE